MVIEIIDLDELKELKEFVEAYNNMSCSDKDETCWDEPISLEGLKKENGIIGMAATYSDEFNDWQVSIDTNDWSFTYEINEKEVLREKVGFKTVIESLGADFDEWIRPLYDLEEEYIKKEFLEEFNKFCLEYNIKRSSQLKEKDLKENPVVFIDSKISTSGKKLEIKFDTENLERINLINGKEHSREKMKFDEVLEELNNGCFGCFINDLETM